MSIICPTVTAYTLDEYREQIEHVASFAERIHLDFMDGDLAPTISPSITQTWWPKGMKSDLHLMYRRPMSVLEDILAHPPSLVIVHMEGEHVSSFIHELHEARIPVGIALLQASPVELLHPFINIIDHVLIFSGNLGHHGGTADLSLLQKVYAVKQMKRDIEIGWDGGINTDNIRALADAGVDVLNTGSAIQRASDPQNAYNNLKQLLQS